MRVQILGTGPPPYPGAAPKRPILKIGLIYKQIHSGKEVDILRK